MTNLTLENWKEWLTQLDILGENEEEGRCWLLTTTVSVEKCIDKLLSLQKQSLKDEAKHYDEVGNPTEYNRGWNEALEAIRTEMDREYFIGQVDLNNAINTLKK